MRTDASMSGHVHLLDGKQRLAPMDETPSDSEALLQAHLATHPVACRRAETRSWAIFSHVSQRSGSAATIGLVRSSAQFLFVTRALARLPPARAAIGLA